MKEFLQEFWLWIAVPFLLVIGALVVLYFMSTGDGPTPFVYNVF
jgi:hypothetical protein